MTTKDRWSSKLSFILATAGAAVGLGNIWKFPYMAGNNGGSAFIILYLIFIALIGVPLLINEITLGKYGRANAPETLRKISQEHLASNKWQLVGILGIITITLVLSFYSVVSGWVLFYLKQSLLGQVNTPSLWSKLLQSPGTMILWHTVFMFLTVGVVALGIKNGIEKASKIMMPLLYIILFFLVYFAYQHGDFKQAVNFLFGIRLHEINAHVAIDALGHAFLTLALGAGAMLVYGAYIPEGTNIAKTVIIITFLDLIVAMLSGLAIFPLVFQYHLAPTDGPGLMFETLPIAFSNLSGGQLIGLLFFVLLIFAAWTSSISMAEPVVLMLIERLKMPRVYACATIGIIAWIFGLLSVFSFNILSSVRILNRWDLFTFITDLVTNMLLPLGGLGFAIFSGWIINKSRLEKEVGFKRKVIFKAWYFLVKYLSPIGILIIILETVF